MQFINSIRRILNGATTHFVLESGSCALQGTSFVELYRKQLKYPTSIVGIEMKTEGSSKAEFRICADGGKIFPFADHNAVPDGAVNIMQVDVAAGDLLTIEVRGAAPKDKFVVIMSELDCIERR